MPSSCQKLQRKLLCVVCVWGKVIKAKKFLTSSAPHGILLVLASDLQVGLPFRAGLSPLGRGAKRFLLFPASSYATAASVALAQYFVYLCSQLDQ